MSAAAISGSFADFKLIKSRSVAQLIIEIPIEQTDAALLALGGVPQPATERPVAIARLVERPEAKPDPRERYAQSDEGTQAVTRAALLCSEQDFQRWIIPTGKPVLTKGMDHEAIRRAIAEAAADELRNRIDVRSRKELATDPDALARFLDLEARFKSERRYGPHAAR